LSEDESSSGFLLFAETCRQVESTSSKLSKIDIVSKYFAGLSNEDLKIASTFLSGKVFSPGISSQEINVGYSLIWKTLSSFHSMKETELSDYYFKYGDLGSAIEDWLRSNWEKIPKQFGTLFSNLDLSLYGFYSTLLELTKASGKGSTQRRQRILERIFAQIKDPIEAKFIVRILGGEMRIGMVEGLVEESIAKAFAKTLTQVRGANLVTGDIGQVAALTRQDRLSEAKLALFHPTNFMLAESAENSDELFKTMGEANAFSEFKYDGIRAQVHFSEGSTKVFSRNLEEITKFFPEITRAASERLSGSLILDGEIVPFEAGRPLSFQSLQRRLRKLVPSSIDAPIKYFAFDLLFKDRPMIDEPLSARAEVLRSLNVGGVIGLSEQKLVSSSKEIQSMFEESKSLGYEGLVVKNLTSPYKPGKRGKSWIKLKSELDTLDVVIVAAEYGHGKRAGVISDYTFAVRAGDELKVVGKAYSGLTDVEILDMTELLKQLTLQDFGYRRLVKPQVILEVAFDAIQKSSLHDSGFALRFPRIKLIRTDKSLNDIDTLEKVNEIYERQIVKLYYFSWMSATAWIYLGPTSLTFFQRRISYFLIIPISSM
jgi:DNA ligase 1